MPAAILLIGVPGSGKSTLASAMAYSPQNSSPTKMRLICPDRIREKLYGNASTQGNWEQIWLQVQQEFAEASEAQHSVIYDATNYKRQYRQEVIALARACNFKPITGLWLDIPLWVCLIRNQSRRRRVPEEIIIDMHNCLIRTPPELSEGFDYLMYRQDREKTENEWMD